MGNLTVEAAEEEDGNHCQTNGEGFPAAPEDVSFKGPGFSHKAPGEGDGAGNDNGKSCRCHDCMDRGAHGAQKVLDFLQVGGAYGHHGKHIHFTAEEDVVADVDERYNDHEEGIHPGNDCPQGGEPFPAGREGGIQIGQRHEEAPQHVVVAQVFFLRQGSKAVGPGEGAHPEKGQNHRPGKKGLQIFPVHHGKETEGYDQEDQKRRPQPGLYVAVDVGKVPANMEQRHNHQRRGYHPGKGG